MKAALASIVFAAGALLGGCGGGGGSSSSSGTGSCTPGPTAAFTISSTGLTPRAVCVLPGGSVTFTNSDTVPHDIESGTTCTELNLGPIPAGQSKVVTFPTTQTCTFFEAAHSTNPAFQGTVAVSSGMTTGPGY
jgi:hypothetical protein